jgi:hypothetical protein
MSKLDPKRLDDILRTLQAAGWQDRLAAALFEPDEMNRAIGEVGAAIAALVPAARMSWKHCETRPSAVWWARRRGTHGRRRGTRNPLPCRPPARIWKTGCSTPTLTRWPGLTWP